MVEKSTKEQAKNKQTDTLQLCSGNSVYPLAWREDPNRKEGERQDVTTSVAAHAAAEPLTWSFGHTLTIKCLACFSF